MKLYIGTRENHKEKFITESDSLHEIRKGMDNYLKKINYLSLYKTSSKIPGDCVEIDFGSYTRFFYIHDVTWEDYLYMLERVQKVLQQ